jgi:hypothetical protein
MRIWHAAALGCANNATGYYRCSARCLSRRPHACFVFLTEMIEECISCLAPFMTKDVVNERYTESGDARKMLTIQASMSERTARNERY